MKIGGFRKPSVSKSLKARTTGRAKRTVNKAVNPLYGKSGMGILKNPEKAIKGKIYEKTTVGVGDLLGSSGSSKIEKTSTRKERPRSGRSGVSATSSNMKVREHNADTSFLAQQSSKRLKLMEAGVDLSFMTETRAKSDAARLSRELFPVVKHLHASFSSSDCRIQYEGLTKSGKVPKSVAKASMIADGDKNDTIIAHLKYLPDGSVNMADFHLWHDSVRHGIKIRRVGREMRITEVVRVDMKRGTETKKYSDSRPTSNEKAMEIIDRGLRGLLGIE